MNTESATARGKQSQHQSERVAALSGMPRYERVTSIATLLALVTVLACVTNASYFAHFQDHYAPDSYSYLVPAYNVATGHGFTDSQGHPETLRTPGYPLFIALFLTVKASLKWLIVSQHLLQVILTLSTTAAAFLLSNSRRLAAIVGILFSIDLPTLQASNFVLTDLLFTLVLAMSLWLLWTGSHNVDKPKATHLCIAGLLAGAAVIVRPVGVYFFAPVVTYLMLVLPSRRKLKASTAYIAAFACLPLIWGARNYRETGYFTVGTISGWEVLCCRAAGALAINDPGDFKTNIVKRRTELTEQACEDLKFIYKKDCADLSFPQKSEYYMRLGRKVMLQHPVASIKVTLRGLAVLMLDGDATSFAEITGKSPHAAIRWLLIYTVPAFCFALAGLAVLWNRNRQFFYFAFLTVAYFIAVSSGGESSARYRVPFIPLYMILIATGVDAALNALSRLKRPARTNS